MACDESRFDAITENKISLVLSVGALDIVNFGVLDTIPPAFAGRKIHVHNEQVSIYTNISLHDYTSGTNQRSLSLGICYVQ
jgi:uncharacterized protein (UPF0261 family)